MLYLIVLALHAFCVAAHQCDQSKCPPQHVNVDFMGFNLVAPCGEVSEAMRIYGQIKNYADCCQICQGDPECGAFTFAEKRGDCALKQSGAAQSPVNRSGVISGKLGEVPKTSEQRFISTRLVHSLAPPPSPSEWMCSVCQHVYDVEKDGGGKAFEDLPDSWKCPVCAAPKSAYKQGPPCDPSKCPPQHVDIDFPGHDLPAPCGNVSGVLRTYSHINQYEDCCTICQGVPECGAFTFSTKDGYCTLKRYGAAKSSVSSRGMISGSMEESKGTRGTKRQEDVRLV